MNTVLYAKKFENSESVGEFSRLRTMPLIELVEEIVNKSDPCALHELHNKRSIFRYHNGPALLLVEYLTALKDDAIRCGFSSYNIFEAVEIAYDLTLDKFSNLPKPTDGEHCKHKITGTMVKQKGPDCRFNYQAFLERCKKSFKKRPPRSEIEKEMQAVGIMQGLVKRHFYRSLLEAERRINPFRSRYNWKINGETLTVYLPVSVKGLKRRVWLEKNIGNPEPRRKGERERIQAIINRKFVNQRMVQLEYAQNVADDNDWSIHWPDDVWEPSLGEIVAREKAENIDRQRPAVRALGKNKLKQLILRVFSEIVDKGYADNNVAKGFISKATFSRFAGSQWKENGHRVPDLWRNTAMVLSQNPSFKEMAAKYQDQISHALERNERHDKNEG